MFLLLCLDCCFYFPSCLKVWLSNRNSKEICRLGERDKMLSVYKVNKETRKRNLNSFFSLFHLQLQQRSWLFRKVHVLSKLCPLWISRSDSLIFFFPLHMVCLVYSAHGQEMSTRSCWQWKHICIMSVLILPKKTSEQEGKAASKSTSGTTRKHLWQLHPSNCCYRNFSYLYSHYDLDFS